MLNTKNTSEIVKHNLILFGLIIFLFFLNFYSKTLFYPPSSTHQWRQADCLSITKNYYEEGMRFFEPKIHYQGPVDGRAVSECPILNYTVAALWKVFGEHEFIYRLLEYLIYLTAIFMLFNTIGRFLNSWTIGFLSVGLLLTSPLLTYYSLNFIADVPALSIAIISLCFLYRFYFYKRMRHFYFALLFGTLAVLMKASALIPLALLYFFSLIDIFGLNSFFRTERLFQKKWLPILIVVTSIVIVSAWYKFALAYNLNNTNNIFLLTVLPIWEMQENEIIYNLKVLFNNLFPVFLNRPMLFLFFVLVFYVVARFRSLNSFLRYSFVFTAIYFVVYISFFFQVFNVHDYYLNNLMIFPVVTFLCFGQLISQTQFLNSNKIFIRISLIVIFIFNAFHAAAIYRLRMIEDDKLVYWFPFVSEDDEKLAKYFFWDYGNAVKKIENLTPALREKGIRREDQTLCIPDQSFNISLYFIDQKGHQISRKHFMEDTNVVNNFRNKKLKYLVLSDTTLKIQTSFKKLAPYLESYFIYNGVEIFKISPDF